MGHRVHDETSMLQLIHNLVLRRHFGDPEVDELTQFVRANSDSLSGVLKILEGAAETFCKAGHTDQAKHLRNMSYACRLVNAGQKENLELRSLLVLNIFTILAMQVFKDTGSISWCEVRRVLNRPTVLPRLTNATLAWVLDDSLAPLPNLPATNILQVAIVAEAAILVKDVRVAIDALEAIRRAEPLQIDIWNDCAVRACEFLDAANALSSDLSSFLCRLRAGTWEEVGDGEF